MLLPLSSLNHQPQPHHNYYLNHFSPLDTSTHPTPPFNNPCRYQHTPQPHQPHSTTQPPQSHSTTQPPQPTQPPHSTTQPPPGYATSGTYSTPLCWWCCGVCWWPSRTWLRIRGRSCYHSSSSSSLSSASPALSPSEPLFLSLDASVFLPGCLCLSLPEWLCFSFWMSLRMSLDASLDFFLDTSGCLSACFGGVVC